MYQTKSLHLYIPELLHQDPEHTLLSMIMKYSFINLLFSAHFVRASFFIYAYYSKIQHLKMLPHHFMMLFDFVVPLA